MDADLFTPVNYYKVKDLRAPDATLMTSDSERMLSNLDQLNEELKAKKTRFRGWISRDTYLFDTGIETLHLSKGERLSVLAFGLYKEKDSFLPAVLLKVQGLPFPVRYSDIFNICERATSPLLKRFGHTKAVRCEFARTQAA